MFLDRYKEYNDYNPSAYRSLCKLVNNFQRLSRDIQISPAGNTYDVLKDTKTKILNTYHSFVYSVPHTEVTVNKFHMGMDELDKLLGEDIDVAHGTVVTSASKEEITTHTKFHYKNELPGVDARNASNFYYFA